MEQVDGMRGNKVNLAVVGALIGLVALSGCGTNAAKAGSSPSYGVGPTGTPVVIEPVKAINGAKRYTNDLFGIDVPAGMTTKAAKLNNRQGTETLTLNEPGSVRSDVIITFTMQKGATDETVAASSTTNELVLRQGGLFTGLQSLPATWQGMDYAVALTGTINLKSGTGTLSKDVIMVTTRDAKRTSIVSVWAEAPVGELTTSQAYVALRTFRFRG
jgi:hypothetical protein